MLGNRTKAAILALALVVLAVEGYLVYRYYAALPSPPGVQEASQRDPETFEETTSEESADAANAFVHRATPGTIVDNSTYLDYPPINNNPDAVLLVTRLQEPDGDVVYANPIGVWYDANRGGSWAIFNQDLAPMFEGATFSVVALEEPGEAVFVHRATPDNTAANATYVDDPSTNGRPDAVLAVTPNWNPGGGAGTYDSHPVGVRYDAEEKRWTILNLDLAPMPEGAAFDVAVVPGTPTG